MNHQKNTMSEKPVIAVTGGGQGIGRAILLYFTERGYNAAVLDMNLETAAAVVSLAREGLVRHGVDAPRLGELEVAFGRSYRRAACA